MRLYPASPAIRIATSLRWICRLATANSLPQVEFILRPPAGRNHIDWPNWARGVTKILRSRSKWGAGRGVGSLAQSAIAEVPSTLVRCWGWSGSNLAVPAEALVIQPLTLGGTRFRKAETLAFRRNCLFLAGDGEMAKSIRAFDWSKA
jgi:hypothetical protein